MGRKRWAGIVLGLLLAGLASGETLAGTIDFESVTAGTVSSPVTYTELVFTDLKIQYLASDPADSKFDVVTIPDAISPWVVSNVLYRNEANSYSSDPFLVTFLNGTTDSFAIGVADYGYDNDEPRLVAYDAAWNVLDTDQATLPGYIDPITGKTAPNPGGVYLTVAATGIKYVKFWDQGDYPGSVFWDGLAYSSNITPFSVVPLPAAGWMGLATLGLLGGLRRFRRRNR
jgi:hypothetical protein